MTSTALLLVLIAAVCHATWNLAAKRASGGLPFIWLSGVLSLTVFTPLALWLIARDPAAITPRALGFMTLSGVLHCGYSIFLQRAYRAGDFSLVYPLARGTGPLLSSLSAIAFLGERPAPLALAGIGAIVASIFLLTGGTALLRGDAQGRGPALAYGAGCGVFIAAYTVADRQAVTFAAVSPLLIDWGGNVARTVLFSPFVWSRRAEVVREWREHRRESWTVALLGPLGYMLVLWALTFSPLSSVAPAREVSILIGTYYGARFLKEADSRRRTLATIGMVAGVIALAVA